MMIWLQCTLLWAQEGFWSLNNIPSNPEWEATRSQLTNRSSTLLSSIVQLPNCTGAIISKSGLVITNAHCIQSYIPEIDTTFHAYEHKEEQPIPNFFVYSSVSVMDVHEQVYKGISKNAIPDYIVYRTERNKRVLLKACREKSSSYRCQIHFDTTTLRYQLVQEERYEDIRIVHLSASQNSDIALVRVYKDGKPIITPQHLKAQSKEPKSLSSIAILGYPNRSHRYPIPIEWTFIQEFIEKTLLYTEKSKTIINASTSPNLHPLRKIILEMERNAKTFLKQYKETSPYEREENQFKNFITWTQEDPSRKKWADAAQEYRRLLTKQHKREQQLLELKWFSLSSDLLFSARRRYGWRESRKIHEKDRISGYRDQDKEALLLHIKNLNQKWNQETEAQLLEQMLRVSSLPSVQKFLKNYPNIEAAISDLYNNTEELLSIQKSLLHLNNRQSLPTNPWFTLGNALEQLHFDILLAQSKYENLQEKAHSVYVEGLQQWLNKRLYADANNSLRISFGTILSNTNLFPRTSYFAKEAALLYSYHRLLPFFTSNVDATHGNSGSVTINTQGEWVGILFGGNVARHTSPYFYANNTENHHISASNILWYFSSHPHWNNIVREVILTNE